MMSALLLPVLLGMTAMAVDLGSYTNERRDLQNAADSMALAASHELPDAGAAQAVADAWAAKNNVDPEDVTVTVLPVSSGNPNPKVTVQIDRSHSFSFIRVLGIDDADVGARAAAVKTSPGGVANLVPWAILKTTQESSEPGDTVTLKYDANNVTEGNFGAIRIDGSGANDYGDTIEDGSSSYICADGVAGCTETSPVCNDSQCPSQTGNMVGPTRSATDYRMDNTDTHCDEFDEVFTDIGDDEYQLEYDCNPWLDGSYESLRVILVPIVDSLCNGACDMTITGFALFWFDGYQQGSCTGNACEIQGRFVNADVDVFALLGKYSADSSIHYTRLVE